MGKRFNRMVAAVGVWLLKRLAQTGWIGETRRVEISEIVAEYDRKIQERQHGQ